MRRLLASMLVVLPLGSAYAQDCDESVIERHTVHGDSMRGRVEDGDVVVVQRSAPGCWRASRGDWVLWQPSGRRRPVLKMVRATGGAHLDLIPQPDGLHIWVDDVELHTASGEPFVLTGGRARTLRAYQGPMPPDSVLLLGEVPGGSIDSTRHGLVHQSDLLGRVIAVEPAGPAPDALVPSPTQEETRCSDPPC